MPHAGSTPSAWVARFASQTTPGGAVLDVACGSGRHLRHFIGLGHPVVGVDRDVSGVADLAGRPGVEILAADLENGAPWPLAADRRFAAVVVTNYLHRPLFPALAAAVADGGLLIYETFAVGNERFGRPRSLDFLLRPGELLAAALALGLTVAAYEHGVVETAGGPSPLLSMRQRMCAVRGDGALTIACAATPG